MPRRLVEERRRARFGLAGPGVLARLQHRGAGDVRGTAGDDAERLAGGVVVDGRDHPYPLWVRLCPVIGPLALAIMLASLVVGAWCLVAAARDRFLSQAQYTALLVLAALVVVQALIATVRLIAGDRPVELV